MYNPLDVMSEVIYEIVVLQLNNIPIYMYVNWNGNVEM